MTLTEELERHPDFGVFMAAVLGELTGGMDYLTSQVRTVEGGTCTVAYLDWLESKGRLHEAGNFPSVANAP